MNNFQIILHRIRYKHEHVPRDVQLVGMFATFFAARYSFDDDVYALVQNKYEKKESLVLKISFGWDFSVSKVIVLLDNIFTIRHFQPF